MSEDRKNENDFKFGSFEEPFTEEEQRLRGMIMPMVRRYQVMQQEEDAGFFRVEKGIRIVLPSYEEYRDDPRLNEIVELAISEFVKTGILKREQITRAIGGYGETPQDIYILVSRNMGADGYYGVRPSAKGIFILAAGIEDVLYAFRTIQHVLLNNDGVMPYGYIVDFPSMAERRLHLDMARKFISKDFIIKHIKDMSYFKMNTLQLHFSENLGFRIECETDPDIVSKDGYLTKADIREILEVARLYRVDIIPSLDTPGHVEHILEVHPEFGQIDKDGNRSKVALDITNENAINYVKSLYKEYMELFKGCYDFHIGCDEYMEFDREPFTTHYKEVLDKYAKENLGEDYTWKDVIANYINDIAEFVHNNGFCPRIWNDGIYYGEDDENDTPQKVKIHDYIGIDFWCQMNWNKSISKLSTIIDKGHEYIFNVNSDFFYYVLKTYDPENGLSRHSFYHPDQYVKIYNEWTPGKFQGNTISDRSEIIRGAALAIWCDKPDEADEDTIAKDVYKELRALACKSWDETCNDILDIEGFKKNCEKLITPY